MPDDKSKRGPDDRARINVGEPYEVETWSKKFQVTPQALKDAVRIVGPMADDVKKHLGK